MNQARRDAVSIWNAAVDAVRARPLVAKTIACDPQNGDLLIDEYHWLRQDFDRVLVVGAGKAGTAMAEGLCEAIGSEGSHHRWPIHGWMNVPEGTEHSDATAGITLHPARPAGVNEPTPAGVAGAEQILKLVRDATTRDLCIALISGGGSALLPAPLDGISLADKLAVTRFLSGAGADITQLNTVRKHLSRIKGGGLLRQCRAGDLVTLVLSDVLGDPLDLIASGPTVPDSSSPKDALQILERHDPDRRLPAAIYDRLTRADAEGVRHHQSAPVPSTTVVIGNNALAVDEAGLRAESLGYNHVMNVARASEGSAESVGEHLAQMWLAMLRPEASGRRDGSGIRDASDHWNNCLITGGEPTVSLAPAEIRGRGGRNQQLVLAAYQELCKAGLSDAQWDRLAILSGGTDGEDGPTDAAGAVLDSAVHARACELGLDPSDFLARNDAYSFFQQCGGLLITGPTGTNVCDVRVALVSS